jgi:hypothetical protein
MEEPPTQQSTDDKDGNQKQGKQDHWHHMVWALDVLFSNRLPFILPYLLPKTQAKWQNALPKWQKFIFCPMSGHSDRPLHHRFFEHTLTVVRRTDGPWFLRQNNRKQQMIRGNNKKIEVSSFPTKKIVQGRGSSLPPPTKDSPIGSFFGS